jgi:hypothetical protein
MSMFGDHTPHQELYDWADVVQREFKLTNPEMVIILQQVQSQFMDPFDTASDELRKRKKVDDDKEA